LNQISVFGKKIYFFPKIFNFTANILISEKYWFLPKDSSTKSFDFCRFSVLYFYPKFIFYSIFCSIWKYFVKNYGQNILSKNSILVPYSNQYQYIWTQFANLPNSSSQNYQYFRKGKIHEKILLPKMAFSRKYHRKKPSHPESIHEMSLILIFQKYKNINFSGVCANKNIYSIFIQNLK